MFFIIKKKYVIISFIFITIMILSIILSSLYKSKYVFISPNSKFTIVIDAGHGGIDGGSVGKFTGIIESELNLIFAKNLANQFNQMDISCVLTRTDSNGLYEKNAKNYKKSDMKKRKEIIEYVYPNIVVSIHMNSFSLSSASGSQTFYKKGNENGKLLADCVQSQLFSVVKNSNQYGKVGDYYMVNCTDIPAILVECGYLSNEEEEKLLQEKDYQNKICYAIMCGILSFFNVSF